MIGDTQHSTQYQKMIIRLFIDQDIIPNIIRIGMQICNTPLQQNQPTKKLYETLLWMLQNFFKGIYPNLKIVTSSDIASEKSINHSI